MSAARGLRLCLVLAAFALAACKSAEPPAGGVAESIDVYLIPVGDFSFELTERLARELSTDVGLNVRAMLPMGAGDLRPLPGDAYQFSTDDLIAAAGAVGSRLPDRSPRSVVIALTSFDINDPAQSVRFLFSKHEHDARTSVLSTARMGFSTPTVEATREQVYARLYKMTKRAIGEQYFGYSRSSDLRDVMYAPIMSLEDIDAMGSDFVQRAPAQQSELPAPPAGYAWHRIEPLRAALLVPAGWHVREQHEGATHAVFVTREEIGASGFRVGVTLNAFLGDTNAPARLKQILDQAAAKYSAPLSVGSNGPFATLTCQFEAPRRDGSEPVRILMLGVANTRTRTSYLLMFESPRSEWDATSAQGRAILANVALESEL